MLSFRLTRFDPRETLTPGEQSQQTSTAVKSDRMLEEDIRGSAIESTPSVNSENKGGFREEVTRSETNRNIKTVEVSQKNPPSAVKFS